MKKNPTKTEKQEKKEGGGRGKRRNIGNTISNPWHRCIHGCVKKCFPRRLRWKLNLVTSFESGGEGFFFYQEFDYKR